MKFLDPKQPSEDFVETVDFTNLLGMGEIISYASAVVKVASGYESIANDAASVVGTVLASAGTAKVVLRKGTHGARYEIRVLVSTSLANLWEEDMVLDVWDFNRFAA